MKFKKLLKYIVCIFLIYLAFAYIESKLFNKNNNLFSFVLNTSENSNGEKNNNILKNMINLITFREDNSVNNLLNTRNEDEILTLVYKDKEPVDNIITKNDKPLIYIYNSHQTEEYASIINGIDSFNPTVITASNILEEELRLRGINSIVETKSVVKKLNESKEDYTYCYPITREFIKEAKKNNPSLTYFIDIHRDSAKKEITTAKIGSKNYAKIMFLVGQNRNNYEKNLETVKKLEKHLEKNYKGITRNTFYRKESHFNQDLNDNVFLIEIGAQYNTIDEIYNSLSALAEVFAALAGGAI